MHRGQPSLCPFQDDGAMLVAPWHVPFANAHEEALNRSMWIPWKRADIDRARVCNCPNQACARTGVGRSVDSAFLDGGDKRGNLGGRPRQHIIEVGADELQIRGAQIGAKETGVAQIGAKETGVAQIGIAQIGAKETGATQVGVAQIGVKETGVAQIGATQVGATQIGATEVGLLSDCLLDGKAELYRIRFVGNCRGQLAGVLHSARPTIMDFEFHL